MVLYIKYTVCTYSSGIIKQLLETNLKMAKFNEISEII